MRGVFDARVAHSMADSGPRARLLAAAANGRGGERLRLPATFASFPRGSRGILDTPQFVRFLQSRVAPTRVNVVLSKLSILCYHFDAGDARLVAALSSYDSTVQLFEQLRINGNSFSVDTAYLSASRLAITYLLLNRATLVLAAGDVDALRQADEAYADLATRVGRAYRREAKTHDDVDVLRSRGAWIDSPLQLGHFLRQSDADHAKCWRRFHAKRSVNVGEYCALRRHLVARTTCGGV